MRSYRAVGQQEYKVPYLQQAPLPCVHVLLLTITSTCKTNMDLWLPLSEFSLPYAWTCVRYNLCIAYARCRHTMHFIRLERIFYSGIGEFRTLPTAVRQRQRLSPLSAAPWWIESFSVCLLFGVFPTLESEHLSRTTLEVCGLILLR